MAKYSVNHMERKIILTKQFASEAKKLDSDSYKILKQLRLDNPGYELEMRAIKNKNPKSACRNLNYGNIRRYIVAREGVGSDAEAQFDVVIRLAKFFNNLVLFQQNAIIIKLDFGNRFFNALCKFHDMLIVIGVVGNGRTTVLHITQMV